MNLLRILSFLAFMAAPTLASAKDCIQLDCPEYFTVECQGTNGAYAQFSVSATDNCNLPVFIQCVPESGSLFPLGETVVTCTATNTLGEKATCTFSVVVVDATPPEISHPQDFVVDCTDWMGATVNFAATATDLCDGVVPVTCDPPSGSVFPNGITKVTCTATDLAGNTRVETFRVTVEGDCGSNCVSVVCPDAIEVGSQGAATVPVTFNVTASHACGGSAVVACDPPSGHDFPIGTTEVLCVAEDGQGNRAACTFQVTVRDEVPPVLRFERSIVVECSHADGSANVEFAVTATDNVSPEAAVTCTPPSGSRFPAGTNKVVCIATDDEGNQAIGEFEVVVVPGFVCGNPVAVPDETAPDNWGFELGLAGWGALGNGFRNQPLTGHVIPVHRIPSVAATIQEKIGGDYWRELAYPSGHKGSNWIGTGEFMGGSLQWGGNAAQGLLISKPFILEKKFVTFLIGGDDDAQNLSVTLARDTAPPGQPPELETIHEANGHGDEVMRREWFDVTAHRGERVRILILDDTTLGHINVDDFQFQDEPPSQSVVAVGNIPRPATVFRDGRFFDWDIPVWGMVDLHTHPMTHVGFGQIVFHGEPDGDIATALRDCNCSHGGFGLDNPCGNYFREAVIKAMDGEGPDPHREGYHPDEWIRFRKWPVFNTISHQQMWHDWIRRAHEGGLRVMVALCVNNQLLAAGALGPGPRDDRTVGDLQIQSLTNFVARHSDFMEIPYDPWQLRDIVRRGKLAVIIGSELDDIGNFINTPNVTPDMVRAEIRRLHSLGVRYIFPVHLVNNKFGGAAIYNEMFNMANKHMTGLPLSAVPAAASDNINFELSHLDVLGLIPLDLAGFAIFGATILPGLAGPAADGVLTALQPGFPPGAASGMMGAVAPAIPAVMGSVFAPVAGAALIYLADAGISLDTIPIGGNYPVYPATSHGHINAQGLTELGTNAVHEMMRLGMMIDLDHMSQRGVEDVMQMAEAVPGIYPMNSGHNTFRDVRFKSSENNRSTNQLVRIRRSGGMMGVGYGNEDMRAVTAPAILPTRRYSTSQIHNTCSGTSRSFAQSYLFALEWMHGDCVALGTDINGFVMGPGPRFGPQSAFGVLEERAAGTRVRADQIRGQHNGVAYTPQHGRPILGAAFDGRGVDPDEETGRPRYEEGYQFNKEQRDFFAAMNLFLWNPSMTEAQAAAFESYVSGNYDRGRVKEFTIGLVKGVTDAPPGMDFFDGDVGTKHQISKAVYRKEVLGEDPPDDVRNNSGKRSRYELLRLAWHFYHRAFGDNVPLTRPETALREWDINFEGVAHYGMLPDFIQDLRNVGMEARDLSPLFHGAECFAAMWERSLDGAAELNPRFIPTDAIQIDAGSLILRYIDTAGEYEIERTAELSPTQWETVEPSQTDVEGIVTTATVKVEGQTGFFRLKKKDQGNGQ